MYGIAETLSKAIIYKCVVVNYRLHIAARRAEALGWRYEAHRRGLDMCRVYLPITQ